MHHRLPGGWCTGRYCVTMDGTGESLEVDVALLLDNRMQSAVHRLLMAEPDSGAMLPGAALEAVGQLVGSDRFGIVEADRSGFCLRAVMFPDNDYLGDTRICHGPLPTGLVHDAAKPAAERAAAEFNFRDVVQLGTRTTTGSVVQLYFDRRRDYFDDHDMAVLTMVAPAIRRLVRSCEGPPAVGCLSRSEREVLARVSTGASNREVAEDLFVTVHTVRKHLENAYRKLGVTNRTAAALKVRAGA
jgi:DNA-binding CsgD family transcriptional regulator